MRKFSTSSLRKSYPSFITFFSTGNCFIRFGYHTTITIICFVLITTPLFNKREMLNPLKKLVRSVKERGWVGMITQLYLVRLQLKF